MRHPPRPSVGRARKVVPPRRGVCPRALREPGERSRTVALPRDLRRESGSRRKQYGESAPVREDLDVLERRGDSAPADERRRAAMSASHGPFLVLALSLLMACREAPGRHDNIAERDTSGPLAAEPPQIVVAAAGPPERDPLESAPMETRSAPLDISGERLEAAWPTLLGKRVRLTAKIERAVDTTRVLVRASGRVFLVNLSPRGSGVALPHGPSWCLVRRSWPFTARRWWWSSCSTRTSRERGQVRRRSWERFYRGSSAPSRTRGPILEHSRRPHEALQRPRDP